jgi:putative FmdB family regulatory protein
MPLYEYYCEDCHGVFELLRPPREASTNQPCPECDADAARVVSNFQAFVFRDGYPRKIPDDGTHWHLGTKVREPVNKAVQPNEHPELIDQKRGPETVPSAEERDAAEDMAFEYGRSSRAGAGAPKDKGIEDRLNMFRMRSRSTARRSQLKRRRKSNAQSTPRTVSGKHVQDKSGS